MITRSGRLTIAARPRPASPATDGPARARSVTDLRRLARAYIALTKPGIIWLLLVTTVPAMVMAQDGWPGLGIVALVLLGGILTAGGANAINQWYDRDIDRIMPRTAQRPIPSGVVPPAAALVWGAALVVAGGVQLLLTVNWLAAVWALAAVAFYVGVYTVWLKRSSVQNIVIGGAAGAVPPLVGWAAVRGDVDVAPVILFLIVFFWTPPHFWALALLIKDDYARAGIPMLPVVAGVAETKLQIFLYTLMLVALSVLFFATGTVGWLYLGSAVALGALFIYYSWRLLRRPESEGARGLFNYSLAYLALLFAAIAVDGVWST